MRNRLSTNWRIFITMLRMDWAQARGMFWGKLIDRFIWMMSLMLVAAYLLPTMGMTPTFGRLMLAGLLASLGIIESYSVIAQFVADLEGDRVLLYYLTLPVSPVLVFMRIVVYNALFFTVLGLVLFPIANFFLPQPIEYTAIHWPKFLSIFLLINLFHGAVVLWATTFVCDMRMLGKIWSRLLHPLWFFGGFQFTWAAVYKKSVLVSYLVLLNPLLYATEGIRSALLGSEGYLPFWVTSGALVGMTVLMIWHGVLRFKKRLDLV